MQTSTLTDIQQQSFIVTGDILAPLFTLDPCQHDAWQLIQSITALDTDALTNEWAFGDTPSVRAAFALMIQGAQLGQESLSWEYRRLFVGPQKKAAPLWGSVYTDHEGVLYGATTLELRQWMREHGVEKTVDETMPEDHLGYQLMLMSFLAQEKPELVLEYLRLHVLTWSQHFLSLMDQRTNLDFYHGVAQLTAVTLAGIQKEYNLDVTIPRFYR